MKTNESPSSRGEGRRVPSPKSEVRSPKSEVGCWMLDVGCSALRAALHPLLAILVLPLLLVLALTGAAGADSKAAAIPLSEIGAKATADYQGDALGVVATAEGARLKCGFQKLEGRATVKGLWLESTAAGRSTSAERPRFQIHSAVCSAHGGGAPRASRLALAHGCCAAQRR